MWTKAHRARHDARLKQMVSAGAVGEIARWLERADPPRSEQRTPLRPVVAALAWHLRVGGAWRAMPAGRLPALADGLWLVPALAGEGPVRGAAPGGGAAATPGRGPAARAAAVHHRHP